MQAQVKLGRIAGIAIGLHYSWFIIAILITLSLAAHFHSITPQWSDMVIWSAAIITGVLFFVALLTHELAHSLVAKAKGLRVRAITLFALGGVSQIESEAKDAKSEFWIAIVGPLASLVIGLVFLWLARISGWSLSTEPRTPVTAVLLWLGYINLMLAAFNMIPGYPLDGGRILRAALWWITHNADCATRWAAQVGQAVALIFILLGLYRFFGGENFGGLWIAFIGWFLLDASRNSYLQVELTAGLRGRSVADIMDRDCPTVESNLSLEDFVNEYLLKTGRRSFVVVQNGRLVGLITPNEVKQIGRDLWAQTSVQAVMRPVSQLHTIAHTIAPDTPAIQALEIMSRENINQLPVLSDGHLQGIFPRGHILGFLQNHAELYKR
ncbi:MAG TPA: site-2 protease family protein [Candidatus Deferrimicrobiaceae bacterium]|nr:site-2 protease family protein [Candidatus Deferrimicrobiaceae bacterium]